MRVFGDLDKDTLVERTPLQIVLMIKTKTTIVCCDRFASLLKQHFWIDRSEISYCYIQHKSDPPGCNLYIYKDFTF